MLLVAVPQAAWNQVRSASGEEIEQEAGAEPCNRWAVLLQSLPRWWWPECESAIPIPSRLHAALCRFPPVLGVTLGDIEYQRLSGYRPGLYLHPPIAIAIAILRLTGVNQNRHGGYQTALRTHSPLSLSSIALSLLSGGFMAAKRMQWIHRINSNLLVLALAVAASHWHSFRDRYRYRTYCHRHRPIAILWQTTIRIVIGVVAIWRYCRLHHRRSQSIIGFFNCSSCPAIVFCTAGQFHSPTRA
jgi:hypothetical protein